MVGLRPFHSSMSIKPAANSLARKIALVSPVPNLVFEITFARFISARHLPERCDMLDSLG